MQTNQRVSRLGWVFFVAITACLLGTIQMTYHTRQVMREVAEVKFESACRAIKDMLNNRLLYDHQLHDIEDVFGERGIPEGIDVEIFEGRSLISSNLVYDSDPKHSNAFSQDPNQFHKVMTLSVANRKWNLSFAGPA